MVVDALNSIDSQKDDLVCRPNVCFGHLKFAEDFRFGCNFPWGYLVKMTSRMLYTFLSPSNARAPTCQNYHGGSHNFRQVLIGYESVQKYSTESKISIFHV